MKYKYEPVVQDYEYSCLEELRVDLFETLEAERRANGKFGWITVIMGTKRANEFLDMLLMSDFNGTPMCVSDDYSIDDMESAMTADVVTLTLCSDGDIIADAYDPSLYCGFDFVVLDKSLSNYDEITERFSSGDDYSQHILRFTI